MIILATPQQATMLTAESAASIVASIPPAHDFFRPLAIAAERDVIDLVRIDDPRTPWPKQMRNTTRPTVCMICDDPGNEDGLGGPDAWRCSSKLKDWAKAAIVHGAAGYLEHYAEAVLVAIMAQRVVMVETTSRNAEAWKSRIACASTLLIVPTHGAHPLANAETFH